MSGSSRSDGQEGRATRGTLALLAVAAIAAVGSLGVILWNVGGLEPTALYDEALRLGAGAFPAGPWRLALHATGVALVAACVSSVVAAALRQSSREPGMTFDSLSARGVHDAVAETRRRLEACTEGASPHIVAAVNELVRGAVSVHASDIHLSPTPSGVKVTYRVHGTLHDVARLNPALAAPLTTRIKVLARLDTYVRELPQDGRLVLRIDDTSVEARVSTLPTESGERVVLRLVSGSVSVPDIQALGFSPQVADGLCEVLGKPQGVLFVTGPVGSGKTTTLYAAMKHIHQSRGSMTNLVTLEDPIELELPFATQTQMKPKAGMTFASTLRSVLRQDPNVLMLGEIRDHETANITMQAGLTGHLILTTVHGEGAAGPFARLMDMRVEPFVVASASLACLSQRLVRVLCTACRTQKAAESIHVERFARLGVELPDGPFYEPVGCEYCEGQGFTGREPVGELLIVTPEIREAVHRRTPTAEVYELAASQAMVPLVHDGLDRAVRGITSLTEVLRVAG